MAIIFDGRTFVSKKQGNLKSRVRELKLRGFIPCLASIIVGENPASELYVRLKKKAAQKIGAELDIYKLNKKSGKEEIITLIRSLNEDKNVHGIMIQLPLPIEIKESKDEIINEIVREKDIDGLRTDSLFLHPTSKAVIQILNQAKSALKSNSMNVCVVGATGMVGAPLVKELKKEGYQINECDAQTENLESETLKADILISTTGSPNLIKGKMIKDGSIVIDVGSPKGDIVYEEAEKKASFITPVPGGVGPVTISCLLENLVESIEDNLIQ